MKTSKMKMFLKILAIVIICLISFMGIYVQRFNFMENKVKGYKLGEELDGYREAFYSINSETSDELKTQEKYEEVRTIFEKRLDQLGIQSYNVNLDTNTGNIYLKLEENDNTDEVIANVKETGKFEIKDSEDGTILLDNSYIKNVRAGYSTSNSGTTVVLQIILNKEGEEILKDLTTNTYAKPVETENKENVDNNKTNSENAESDEAIKEDKSSKENMVEENKTEDTQVANNEEKTEKKVTFYLSGQEIETKNFENPIENGIIQFSLNKATTDSKQISEAIKSGNLLATTMNNGPLPIEYTLDLNQNVTSDISLNTIYYRIIGIGAIIGILLIYMIVKNKFNGLLAAISFIGFNAVYLLLLRYTNVVISLSSIVGIVIIAFINYFYTLEILSNKDKVKDIIKFIPIFVVSIVFSFARWTEISSIGMTTMWGILLMIAYNKLITKHMIDNK